MKTSSSLDEWCDDLGDMDFWLNGYLDTDAYHSLQRKLDLGPVVHWNVGVGPTASFTRTIATIYEEVKMRRDGPFDHVIKVELRKEPTEEAARGSRFPFMSMIELQLAAAVAEELGLLDQKYKQLKESDEELRYYTYGMEDLTWELQRHVYDTIVPRICTRLVNERYLLVVDNLYEPINPTRLDHLGLPSPNWRTNSHWLMSTTSQETCDRSKTVEERVLHFSSEDEILMLILSALHQSAKFISDMICQQDEQYWHHVALRCFHYAMLLPVPQHPPPPPQEDIIHSDGDRHSYNNAPSIISDELIRQWAAQGIITAIKPRRAQESTEEKAGSYHNKYDDIHQVGNVILQAFRKYSLLQLPFSLATKASVAAETAAQFLTYHGLTGERLTVNKLLDSKEYMEQLKWISFVDHDQGRHVSTEWLSHEITNGPTALILRGCSHQLPLFSQLSSFLSKLCFLRILDISYTPLKSLPSSIGCLVNLRLLSLRGCRDLTTLLISSSTTDTADPATHSSSYSPLSTLCQLEVLDMNGVPFSDLTQDMGNQKSNLMYLDMSYSEVTTFPLSFFQDMSNLEMLVLVKCPNLVELPPSMAALLSLTTLEVTGTQIESFPEKIFEEMKKLQSLKLIDNKKLISLPGSLSRANGLIELHVEGWESSMMEEIKLDGHPTLRSFLLIAAPHIRRLFLNGCRKLESVELKDLGALELLDLSATAIKELPADIPNLPQLRRLLLMDVPSLKRFPWHKLQRLLDVFCLDHCAEEIGNHPDKVAQVCINDVKLFRSFNKTARDLARDGRLFQSLHIQVALMNASIRQLSDEEGMLDSKLQELVKKQSTYVDVHSSYKAEEVAIFSPMIAPLHRTGCHVEISAMHRYPDGLDCVLQVTRSISVTCDTSISYLYDLSSFDELEECELRWCHQMKGVIHADMDLKNLRRVHASNLKSLAHFCVPSIFGQLRFSTREHLHLSTLEHLHLKYCPRLEAMMPGDTRLPCLKTLDILFCYNLKTIFYTRYPGYRSYQLPRLQKIRLQELPRLQHLQEEVITAPMWKELHVRGCWSLRRLPRLQDQPRMVEVNGERSWWGKIHWDSLLHRNSYDPKLPPAYASFDECAEIKSYLR